MKKLENPKKINLTKKPEAIKKNEIKKNDVGKIPEYPKENKNIKKSNSLKKPDILMKKENNLKLKKSNSYQKNDDNKVKVLQKNNSLTKNELNIITHEENLETFAKNDSEIFVFNNQTKNTKNPFEILSKNLSYYLLCFVQTNEIIELLNSKNKRVHKLILEKRRDIKLHFESEARQLQLKCIFKDISINTKKNKYLCVYNDLNGQSKLVYPSDINICVFDLIKKKIESTLIGHNDIITFLKHYRNCYEKDHLVSASLDKTIKFWNLWTGQLISTINNMKFDIFEIGIVKGVDYLLGSRVSINDKEYKMFLYPLKGKNSNERFQYFEQLDKNITYSIQLWNDNFKKENYIVVGGSNDILFYDFSTLSVVKTLKSDNVYNSRFLIIQETHNMTLIVDTDMIIINIWNYNSSLKLAEISVPVSSLLTWNHKYFIGAGNDGEIKVFNLEDFSYSSIFFIYPTKLEHITKFVHHSNGESVLTCYEDGKLCLWSNY